MVCVRKVLYIWKIQSKVCLFVSLQFGSFESFQFYQYVGISFSFVQTFAQMNPQKKKEYIIKFCNNCFWNLLPHLDFDFHLVASL